MADSLKPDASPNLLEKPRGIRPPKLNSRPVMIVVSLLTVVGLALMLSIFSRGAGSGGNKEDVEPRGDASKQAEEITAGQPLGAIGEAKPDPQPPAPGQQTDSDDVVELATLTTPAPPPEPPSALELELRQRYINLVWERHARLVKAVEAETKIDFETKDSRAAAGPAPGFNPASEFQATLPGSPFSAPGLGADASDAGAAGLNPDPNKQAQKRAFLDQPRETGALRHRRQAPKSPYEIKTGAIIPAVMIGGINSDLPGAMIAQVSQDVWDTATGVHLLIPQGTRLYGTYDSEVSYGQNRVLVVWSRLIFPDASTLELEGMPGADQAGYGGFRDKVDRHLFRIFGSAVLLSIVGSAFEISQPTGDSETATPQQTAAAQLAQELGNIAREQISKEMDAQPTLVIRPGYRFNVMVTKDLTLKPYIFGGRRAAQP